MRKFDTKKDMHLLKYLIKNFSQVCRFTIILKFAYVQMMNHNHFVWQNLVTRDLEL